MLKALTSRLFKNAGDKAVSRLMKRVDLVIEKWGDLGALSDDELRLAAHSMRHVELPDQTDSLALACEISVRALHMSPYPVQIAGALALLDGEIAEMRTGEGKTLVAGLAAFVGSFGGQVHVVTVNEYLARRDAENIGRLHRFAGLTVGVVVPGLTDDETRAAYASNVVYATASQIGFDHLKDGLVLSPDAVLQSERRFAIVDEIDSVLIDEARTPLIISHPDGSSADRIGLVAEIVGNMAGENFRHDEKNGTAVLTDEGEIAIEDEFVRRCLLTEGSRIFDVDNVVLAHRVNQAVNARFLLLRDRNYAVVDGRILIVDQGTGRIMHGRQFSDGLHQAVEAKEGVGVTPETMTLASVSIQNLFRGYVQLSGMTGTAMSDADEFAEIYRLQVMSIPTNLPSRRTDEADEIYRTDAEKIAAVVSEIRDSNDRMQPILVGTSSVEKSRALAVALVAGGFEEIDGSPESLGSIIEAARHGVSSRKFCVLNALAHEREAGIVAQAGVPGAITVATNMAGRGTDIKLGGEPKSSMEGGPLELAREAAELERFRAMAEAAGGLYVIGTERAENRRIDDQLRGRSGRQGEPGRSKFYLSLEDDLLRVFGGVGKLIEMADLQPGQAISHKLADKIVRDAQVRIEKKNFDTRSDLVRFDDVVEIQRKEIAKLRAHVMETTDFREWVDEIQSDLCREVVERHAKGSDDYELWDTDGLEAEIQALTRFRLPVRKLCEEKGEVDRDRFVKALVDFTGSIRAKVVEIAGDRESERTRVFMLTILDAVWRDHMTVLDRMRKGATFTKIGGRDPIVEYRTEAGEALESMLRQWKWFVFRETHALPGEIVNRAA